MQSFLTWNYFLDNLELLGNIQNVRLVAGELDRSLSRHVG